VQLVIDTDAGVDDAQAIIMALTTPGVEVTAFTTVTGNVHVSHVNRNVFTVLDLMGKTAPVYPGADQPLLPGFWEPEERVHGQDGLGGCQGPARRHHRLESEPAAAALVRLANERPGELTLVALGPLTNLALACRLDPGFPAKIKQFVFMGGTMSGFGNTRNVTAEFNAFCDPEAGLITLEAFAEATMLCWETTIQHPFSWEQYDRLAAIDTPAGRFFRDSTHATAAYIRQFPQVRGYLLPDPLAMAIALNPALIQGCEHAYVTMEVQGTHTRGQTVIDRLGVLGRAPNTYVVTDLDTGGVYRMYERMLGA
jgi:purine nucleosidase